jgi:hypothetical protein
MKPTHHRFEVRMLVRVLLAAAILFSTGCLRRTIPGTQIPDSADTQEILGVIKRYVAAMEGRDVEGVMSLVAPDFLDNGGTSSPEDDLDYKNLGEALQRRFEKVDRIRLEVDVRDIAVGENDAAAVYYYSLRYDMPQMVERAQSASELKRMTFKRTDGGWKILSGI